MTSVVATNQTILVVGGGISGMTAALEAAVDASLLGMCVRVFVGKGGVFTSRSPILNACCISTLANAKCASDTSLGLSCDRLKKSIASFATRNSTSNESRSVRMDSISS